MKKRTECDFTKHELNTFNDKYTEIYDLKIPNVHDLDSRQFLFCNSVYPGEKHLVVSGYVSTCVFTHKFSPSTEEDYHSFHNQSVRGIDELIWCGSAVDIQDPYIFDVEGTIESIKREPSMPGNRNAMSERIIEIERAYYNKLIAFLAPPYSEEKDRIHKLNIFMGRVAAGVSPVVMEEAYIEQTKEKYIEFARKEMPEHLVKLLDLDYRRLWHIPIVTKPRRKFQLIFDAMEEICSRTQEGLHA